MSRTICPKIRRKCLKKTDMLYFKSFMPETLADYLARKMRELNISGYEIERRSQPKVTQSYINRIRIGVVKNPSVLKLRGIAHGLGVPASEMLAAAAGVDANPPDISDERLSAISFAYEGMPKKKRQKADAVIEMLEREINRIESEPD